jgi:hypothetical protein
MEDWLLPIVVSLVVLFSPWWLSPYRRRSRERKRKLAAIQRARAKRQRAFEQR